ncbi:uncharacterized protein LOC119896331 [Micropterus salmoides]|uniref:uncharacterized protein LOC119896331 n=1 Tax=Micropterus salmoides TaxID=27706 RepID=UPI0018ED21C6|nr:uncharacterized protein LOC119896331 [Micropterus salmoides]
MAFLFKGILLAAAGKMAVLYWMAVTLGLFLSAGNSLADVDQNQLAGIVKEILNRYRPSYTGSNGQRREPMFSLAVSIPYDSDRKIYNISQVTDTREQVWQSILKKCEVYTSKRMVAATVLRWPSVVDQCPEGRVQWSDLPTKCGQTWADVKKNCPTEIEDGRADHAEYRILQNFTTLVSNHDKMICCFSTFLLPRVIKDVQMNLVPITFSTASK